MSERSDTRERVLIVDDATENIDILVEALHNIYAVSVARDGERALRIAGGKTPPDIILLDIVMPGMDGYEVCTRLKADPVTRHIPIIFLTALDNDNDEERGLKLGAVDYVSKPVSVSLLTARVENHLNLARAQRALSAQVSELEAAATLREDVDRIMRHDLKNPLTAILGLPALMLDDQTLTEDHRESLGMIREAGLRMLSMINNSLDLFKMERGTYPYQPTTVNLTTLVRHVMEDLDSSHDQTGQISATQQGDIVYALGEENLCYSILSNLVKNAKEASPAEEPVTITLRRDDSQAVVVIHNQRAVPQDLQDRFFEKYATAGKAGGNGIGTYSARLMARTMGGEIDMASNRDQGTTLTVRLPAGNRLQI